MTYVVEFKDREFEYMNDMLQLEQGIMATYEIEVNYTIRKKMRKAYAEVKWDAYTHAHPLIEMREYQSKEQFLANEFFIPAHE